MEARAARKKRTAPLPKGAVQVYKTNLTNGLEMFSMSKGKVTIFYSKNKLFLQFVNNKYFYFQICKAMG